MTVKNTIRLSKLALFIFAVLGAIITLELLLRINFKNKSANDTDSNITDENIYENDSQLGWKGRPNVNLEGNFQSEKIRIETNKNGFRDNEFLKVDEKKRVVFLGDSFIWGWGIEKEKRFDEFLLSKLGQNWQGFNLGMNGYSSDQEIITYNNYNSFLEPNVIVLFFYANDLNDNLLSFAYSKPKPLFIKKNGNYQIVLPENDENNKTYNQNTSSGLKTKIPKNLYTLRILGGFLINNQLSSQVLKKLGLIEVTPDEKIEFSTGLIEHFADIVKGNGQKLIIVTIPHRIGYETISFNRLFKKFEDELLERFSNQSDVVIVRLFDDALDTETYYLPWPDIHLNEKGHDLLSEKLYAVIKEWKH